MDPFKSITLRDISATTATLFAFVTVALLISSGTATEDVLAASGLVTEFVGAGDEVEVNFTKIGGSENTDYSLRLPKQSNVVDARVNFTGSDIFMANQIKTFKSAFDFRQGTATNLIYDTSGLHLDMDTMAPFWPYTEKSTGSEAYDVVTGDFNNDRRPDFAVTNKDADSVTIYYQNAQGKMATKTTHSTSDDPYCIDVGDFNNDGLDDLAVGCYAGKKVDFLRQKSTGGFTLTTVTVNENVQGIATGDLNNDGFDDVALATYGKKGMTLLQSGTGSFSVGQTITVGESGNYYYYNYDVKDVAVADFNGDGRDDVVWSSAGGYSYNYDRNNFGKIKFYYQTTSRTLSYNTYVWGYTGCWFIEAGDITGDGKPDIAFTQNYVNKIKYYTRSGSGWSGPTNLGGDGQMHRLAIGDLDGDGKNDLVSGSSKPSLLFYKQVDNKLTTQAKKFDLPDDSTGRGTAVGDFNGDGHNDVVVACGGADSAAIFAQRLEYDGSYVSQPLVQPLPVRFVNFTYHVAQGGGETHFYYSVDGGINWTEVANRTLVDLVDRTDTLWFKMTFHSTSATRYNSIKWVTLNMTYQSFPSNLRLDLGRDSSIEWNMTGELNDTVTARELNDALTDYIQDPSHYPDEHGYLTIPIYISSATPGQLTISDLYVLYNNASRKPELVTPGDRGFVNATPTLQFYANDTDDDLLKYVIQVAKGGDFGNAFATTTFDMRYSLYNEEEGEGFTQADYRQGTVATFTIPELYALDDDTSYSWRVYAYDGYLVSRPSPVYVMRVDSFAPTGHASTPRYSNSLNFTVTWSAEDMMPGSGLAPAGTYDVQYRKSTEPTWQDWLVYTTKTSEVFAGEEGITYYFRMRSRDAVWNEQLFIGGKGDTQTTVDSQAP
ncbi:MAG: VCBS repeat-containing protein, partial [Thermoplasmata archaeon]